ncbi:MAG: hypothetical protein GY947_03715 [Rhodobacteraceae bacterium]|nr:hypothetical protein [Paracoccaceae bacterium]
MFANMVAKITNSLPLGAKFPGASEVKETSNGQSKKVYRNFESETEVEQVSQFMDAVSDALYEPETDSKEFAENGFQDLPATDAPLSEAVCEAEFQEFEEAERSEFAAAEARERVESDPLGLDEGIQNFEDQGIDDDIMNLLRDEDLDWGEPEDEAFLAEEREEKPENGKPTAPLVLRETEMLELGDFVDPSFFDEAVAEYSSVKIAKFDADEESLQIEYLPQIDPETGLKMVPVVAIEDFDDETGAFIALDGVVVAEVIGAQYLDPAEIILVAV